MADMVKVYFIKAGTPYGYGYAAGEFGVVRKEDFEDGVVKDKQGKEHLKQGLLSRGIVRPAGEAEFQRGAEAQEEKAAAKVPGKAKKPAKSAAKSKGAEGPESGAGGEGDEKDPE